MNLDEWIVWSLAATASPIQATAIRSLISNHIAFKATLDVDIPVSVHFDFYGGVRSIAIWFTRNYLT